MTLVTIGADHGCEEVPATDTCQRTLVVLDEKVSVIVAPPSAGAPPPEAKLHMRVTVMEPAAVCVTVAVPCAVAPSPSCVDAVSSHVLLRGEIDVTKPEVESTHTTTRLSSLPTHSAAPAAHAANEINTARRSIHAAFEIFLSECPPERADHRRGSGAAAPPQAGLSGRRRRRLPPRYRHGS